jgi:SAM-dependent methyltransferase
MKKSYIDVKYSEHDKPFTDYPSNFAKYIMDRFHLKKGDSLLDTGTGRAEMLNAFGNLGMKVEGCDLEAPPASLTRFTVKEFDLTKDKFPYENDTFDVVFSKSVLEHIYEPKHYLREIYRILAPGGILILLTPDWKSQYKTFYDESTHVHAYTTISVKDSLVINGFQDVGVELFHHHEFIWRSTFWRILATFLSMFYTSAIARKLEKWTGVKYLRWAAEKNVLGYGYKQSNQREDLSTPD